VIDRLTGITPGPYAVVPVDPDVSEANFGEWMIVAPVDPDLPLDVDNSMTVAIVMTTRETADLFAGSGELLAAAQAQMRDWRHDCPEAFRQAVKKCEGWQP
jgi:hypothetical protein